MYIVYCTVYSIPSQLCPVMSVQWLGAVSAWSQLCPLLVSLISLVPKLQCQCQCPSYSVSTSAQATVLVSVPNLQCQCQCPSYSVSDSAQATMSVPVPKLQCQCQCPGYSFSASATDGQAWISPPSLSRSLLLSQKKSEPEHKLFAQFTEIRA